MRERRGVGLSLVRGPACSAVAMAARSFYDAGMIKRAVLCCRWGASALVQLGNHGLRWLILDVVGVALPTSVACRPGQTGLASFCGRAELQWSVRHAHSPAISRCLKFGANFMPSGASTCCRVSCKLAAQF